MSDQKFAFIHVEKTAGWSIRLASWQSKQIKYIHHQSITDQLARDYTTVVVMRHPVKRFISWFRWVYRHHDFENNVESLVDAHLIDTLHVFNRYHDFYFANHQPDIMLQFNDIQNEWSNFVEINNILDADKILKHKHALPHVDIKLSQSQRDTIHEVLNDDLNKYSYGNNTSSTI